VTLALVSYASALIIALVTLRVPLYLQLEYHRCQWHNFCDIHLAEAIRARTYDHTYISIELQL
jgi:hypothetical protein